MTRLETSFLTALWFETRGFASLPIARVEAEPHAVAPLVVDLRTHEVFADGREVALTPKEFDLLAHLASDPGTALLRRSILEEVWDANWYGSSKTLDVHVASLRRKLGHPEWIQAVRGVGFKLVAEAS